jgi:hypothetical protein
MPQPNAIASQGYEPPRADLDGDPRADALDDLAREI